MTIHAVIAAALRRQLTAGEKKRNKERREPIKEHEFGGHKTTAKQSSSISQLL